MQLLSETTTRGTSAGACARDLLDTVPAVMQFIRTHLRGVDGQELSVPQVRSLSFINRNVRPSLSDTAFHIGLSLPAMSRLVECLVRKGLVDRTMCPTDRRHVRLELTDAGRDALNLAWQGTRTLLADELRSLTPEQRTTISAALALLHPLFEATNAPQSSGCADADEAAAADPHRGLKARKL